MNRYIVRNIDGKFAVQQEHAGVATFCDSMEAAVKLAQSLLLRELPQGREHIEKRPGGETVIWRE